MGAVVRPASMRAWPESGTITSIHGRRGGWSEVSSDDSGETTEFDIEGVDADRENLAQGRIEVRKVVASAMEDGIRVQGNQAHGLAQKPRRDLSEGAFAEFGAVPWKLELAVRVRFFATSDDLASDLPYALLADRLQQCGVQLPPELDIYTAVHQVLDEIRDINPGWFDVNIGQGLARHASSVRTGGALSLDASEQVYQRGVSAAQMEYREAIYRADVALAPSIIQGWCAPVARILEVEDPWELPDAFWANAMRWLPSLGLSSRAQEELWSAYERQLSGSVDDAPLGDGLRFNLEQVQRLLPLARSVAANLADDIAHAEDGGSDAKGKTVDAWTLDLPDLLDLSRHYAALELGLDARTTHKWEPDALADCRQVWVIVARARSGRSLRRVVAS